MGYDVYNIRKQFPMLNTPHLMQGKPLVYLDNASTTFKPQCVIDAMNDYYTKWNANSHRGDYDLLYHMDQLVLEARKSVAKFVNCEPREVVFTSGTTMSINLLANGLKHLLKPSDEIILSEAEHASNVLPWFNISKQTGSIIKFVPLNSNGEVTKENLESVISNKTKIVALAHVSNVLGSENDIKSLCPIVHKYGALFCVDGAQSVPHLKTDFKDLNVDFLSFSGHKLCGPTGTGCLIGKYDLLNQLDPFIVGGGDNIDFDIDASLELLPAPEKFEAGTLNLAGIIGLKAAVEFVMSIGIDNIHNHDKELIDYALSRLSTYDKIIIYNPNNRNGILTFNIKDVFAQDEATLLNSKGIAVRSGQHCAKLLYHQICTKATVRLSTYLYTTKEEIDAFVDAIINGGDILDAYFSN